ncbi:hypothetical protein QUF83_26240 [Bacillus cereus]|nr:hypothetical protein [Bacillus cereus]MDM5239501.1 hypothetical protein [Bacillus cereus]
MEGVNAGIVTNVVAKRNRNVIVMSVVARRNRSVIVKSVIVKRNRSVIVKSVIVKRNRNAIVNMKGISNKKEYFKVLFFITNLYSILN